MKKRLIFILLSLIIFSFSCKKDNVEIKNYLMLDGKQIIIDGANIDDKGTDLNATPPVRMYAVEFYEESYTYPKNVLRLLLYSPDTERLDEGSYSYKYSADAGHFSYVSFSFDLTYDSDGVKTGGTVLYETDINTNSENLIQISREEEDKIYDGNLNFEKDGEFYNVKLYFKGALTERNISIY